MCKKKLGPHIWARLCSLRASNWLKSTGQKSGQKLSPYINCVTPHWHTCLDVKKYICCSSVIKKIYFFLFFFWFNFWPNSYDREQLSRSVAPPTPRGGVGDKMCVPRCLQLVLNKAGHVNVSRVEPSVAVCHQESHVCATFPARGMGDGRVVGGEVTDLAR